MLRKRSGHAPKRAFVEESPWRRAKGAALGLLLFAALSLLAFGAPTQAASLASEGLCTAARRGVDLALPAVVRLTTTYQAQLTYTTADGTAVTFPQGGGTYTLTTTGSGAFISGSGDLLTAASAVNASQATLNLLLAERAAPDIAQALNNSNPSHTFTSADILNQLLTDPSIWQPTIQPAQPSLYLSSSYSGAPAATSVEGLQSYPVTILAQSSDQGGNSDLALLHVDGLRDMPTIPLGDAHQVYQDDPLTIIGYPASADLAGPDGSVNPSNFITPSVRTVTVSAFKTAQDGSQLIQIDGDTEQGDSGSPALNADGHLVGVVSLAAGAGSGQVGFLQQANDAQLLIQQAKVNLAQDAFDQRWAAAYDACISTVSGHWHDAYNLYTQLARLYPNFKGVQPYITYTRAQAAHEPVPIRLPGWAIALLVVLLLAGAAAAFLLLRRRLRRRGVYAGYGPGLTRGAPYTPGGYSLGSSPPSRRQPGPLVASEQIGAAVPAAGDPLPTVSDPLTPASPTMPTD